MTKKNFWRILILAGFLISFGWLTESRGGVEDEKSFEPVGLE